MGRCPEPWVLEAFAQGRLDAPGRRELEAHIDHCHACGETIAEIARLFGSARWQTHPSHPSGASPEGTAPLLVSGPGDSAAATGMVGRYRLGRRLGAGAMGIVFEAHDPELHRNVAVKLLHAGVGTDADDHQSRLLREARAMAQLAHPNVVAVHDVGRVGEQIFVAMELVEGTTLGAWLREKRRTVQRIVEIFVQAGRGLEAAHAVGLVHRDFKPDNVLIGRDDRARVTDFGLARPIVSWSPRDRGSPSVHDTGIFHDLTAHGSIVGTPAYMAPEQWRGQPADARSDQFAFCVALFEALALERPFSGDDIQALAHNVLHGKTEAPPRSLPAWLRKAIMTGLTLDPAARHASMTALLAALDRDRSATRRLAAIAGAMAVGAVATVGVLQWVSAETVPLAREPAETSVGETQPAEVPHQPLEPDPSAATAVCVREAQEVDGHWTAKRRQSLAEHVAKMERGDELEPRVLAALDDWAQRYVAASVPLCAPDSRTPLSQARRRCLDDAVTRFHALLVAIEQRRPFETQRQILGATRHLPHIERCNSEPWLAALPPPPSADQAAAARLVASDRAAAEATANLMLLTEAPGQAEHAANEAKTLGYAPLLAEAELTVGGIAAIRQQTDIAVQWLERAVVTAEGARYETVRGRAAIALIEAQGARQLRFADAKRWQRIATTYVETVADPNLAADLRLAEARLLQAEHELAAARDLLLAAPGIEAADPSDTPEEELDERRVAQLHISLSEVLADLGDAEGAVRHGAVAAQLLRNSVGPDDLVLCRALLALGRAQLLAGELDRAEASASMANDIPLTSTSLLHDIERGHALELLGDIQVAREQPDQALQSYDKAAIYHYTGPWRAWPLLREGALRVQLGETSNGLARLQEALVVLEEHYAADDPRLLPALRALGRGQRAAGKLDDARTTLTRALDIAEATGGYGPLLARAQIDLAELERQAGNAARALELFDDAHVPWVGALGMEHRLVVDELLARADLAWSLGQKKYAQRLYRSTHERFVEQYGAQDPRTKRAAARRGHG